MLFLRSYEKHRSEKKASLDKQAEAKERLEKRKAYAEKVKRKSK